MLISPDFLPESQSELKQLPPKINRLIHEFELLPPTETTFNEARQLIDSGLPFVKSVTPNSFKNGS